MKESAFTPCCSASGGTPCWSGRVGKNIPRRWKRQLANQAESPQHGRNVALLLVDLPAYHVESTFHCQKYRPPLSAKKTKNDLPTRTIFPCLWLNRQPTHSRSSLPTESSDRFSYRHGRDFHHTGWFCLINWSLLTKTGVMFLPSNEFYLTDRLFFFARDRGFWPDQQGEFIGVKDDFALSFSLCCLTLLFYISVTTW